MASTLEVATDILSTVKEIYDILDGQNNLDSVIDRVAALENNLYGGSGADIIISSAALAQELMSSNYVADTSGWKIKKSGTAEFQNIIARGDIQATSGTYDGILSIGLGGGIYQGTGTFASPTTGLKIWNDGGIGRIAGFNSGTIQWYGDTDGAFYGGGGKTYVDEDGINFDQGSLAENRIKWWDGTYEVSRVEGYEPDANYNYLRMYSTKGDATKYKAAVESFVQNNSSYGKSLIYSISDGATFDYAAYILHMYSNNLGGGAKDAIIEIDNLMDMDIGANADLSIYMGLSKATEIVNIDATNTSVVSGYLDVRQDEDVTSYIGRCALGQVPSTADAAGFGHLDNFTGNTTVAFWTTAIGDVYVNAKTGRTIDFRVNNVQQMDLTSSGLALYTGTRITEFSVDENMDGNSDLCVPTEQAVQEYAAGWLGWTKGGSSGSSTSTTTWVAKSTATTVEVRHGEAFIFAVHNPHVYGSTTWGEYYTTIFHTGGSYYYNVRQKDSTNSASYHTSASGNNITGLSDYGPHTFTLRMYKLYNGTMTWNQGVYEDEEIWAMETA